MLSLAWVHRMQFFYDLEQDSGQGDAFEYSEVAVAGYREPADFQALVATLEGRQLGRALSLRDLNPGRAAGSGG